MKYKMLFILFFIMLPQVAQASTIKINDHYSTASYYVNPSPPAQSSELLVIGVYDTNTDHSGGTRWEGVANVNIINGGSVPVTVVLSSYEPALWLLTVEPGVQINRIILNGYNKQRVSVSDLSGNVITTIPITDKSGVGNYYSACAYAWPSSTGGCDTPGLISKVEASTGLKLTSFAGAYRAADFTIVAGSNDVPELPVAKAGADQTVTAGSDGFAQISLDGSGSYSLNNQALTYRWCWPFNGVLYQAEGEYPTIQLPACVHTIQLIVSDGIHNSVPAYVHITVIAPQPPQPPQVEGITYTATITADNYYAVYTGTPQNLWLVGKYSDTQFQTAETFTFTAKPGEYIYVAAWNAGGPKAWIGQFVSDVETVLSNKTDWEVFLTNDSSAIACNAVPSANTVMADLSGATWSPVDDSMDPPGYWGNVDGIDPNAKWIWGSSISQFDNVGEYQLFRTKVPSLPIADAGANQTVRIGSTVLLNGSGSSDPDGKYPLSYSWSFVSADTNNPALSDPSSAAPTFVANKIGDYNLKLIVSNSLGRKSVPAYVIVSTYNTAPVAQAGPDQALKRRGTSVQLDGSHSYDPDGDSITYSWGIDSAPQGSTAALSNSETATPTFVPDVYGDYVLNLRVTDEWGTVGDDTVILSFENLAPVADARYNQSIILGESAVFDGSLSTDPNEDPLTYLWNTISAPKGSEETLVNATAMLGSFTPDLPGTYILGLVVSDGQLSSSSSNITIAVVTRRTAAIIAVKAAIDYINNLYETNPGAFKNRILADAMTKQLNRAVGLLDKRLVIPAVITLYDALAKTDGKPFPADYIVDKTARAQLYALILNAIKIINKK